MRQNDSHVEVTVTDTGIGFTTSFRPHLFERFRQAESGTTRAHGGLGLGLAIARHIVEMHGGTIDATSEGEGKGATFSVALPVSRVSVRRLSGSRGRLREQFLLPSREALHFKFPLQRRTSRLARFPIDE